MGRNSVRTYPPAQRNSVRTYLSARRISVRTYLSAGRNPVRTYPPARRCFPRKILKNDDDKPVKCARCHRTYSTREIFKQHLPTCSSDFILTVSECDCKKTRSSEVDKQVYNNAFADVKHERCEPEEQNESAVQLSPLATLNVSIESSQTSPAELTNRTNSTLLFYSVVHQPIASLRSNESNVIDPPTNHQSPLLVPVTAAVVSSITTPTIFSQNSLKTTQMDTRFAASIVPQVDISDVSKQSAHPSPLPPSHTVQTSVLSSIHARPTDGRSRSWTYAQAASQSQTSCNFNCQPAATATATATPMPGPQYQMHMNHTPCVEAPQPKMFVQQVQSPNVVPAFVDAFQQHTGQSLQYIGRIDAPSKDPLFTPTAGSVASTTYQLQTSTDGFTGIQNGSIPVMPSPSQPTVLGTIVTQERPAALQCSTVATEKRIFGSTTGMEIFTDQNDGVTVVERREKTSLTTQKKNMKSLKMFDSGCNTSGNKNEMEICFAKIVAPNNNMASINLVDSEHNTSVNISDSVEVSFDKIARIEKNERVEVDNDTVESRHFRRREKTCLIEPKKPMKSLKMIDSKYNSSEKVNETMGDCFDKIDAPREHTVSIKMVDSEHNTSANISASVGVSFDKIGKIEENERVEVAKDTVESMHFRRREKTSLTESKEPMKSLKMVDSKYNTSEKANESMRDCFDKIDAPREPTESIKMVDSEHTTSANTSESVGVSFDKIARIKDNERIEVGNDPVESRHFRRREKTSLIESKKPMKSLKMVNSKYNTSEKANESMRDCFDKIDAPREPTESITMVDSEHNTSANTSESVGVSFDKIARIEENERVEVGNDPVERRHFRRREKTSLTEPKKSMKSLKKVDSEYNTSANISESMGVCFDKIDKIENNESVTVGNDTVESRHLRNTSLVLPNQGTRQTNAFPDSPISMTESSDSNDLPSKRKILKRRKRIGAQRVKNVKKFSKDSIYEVEYILDYIEFEEDAYYLVKWKNWESIHNSWEPKENVTNCEKILNEYFSSVYGSFTNSRECIDSFGKTLVKPTREALEELMSSLVKDGVVQYEVPSLRKVCMALNALLGLPEVERSESVESLKMFIMLRCLHVKRKRQLKSLKEWEDEINASSNTAAHIVVENEVDLEGPPDNFYYVNEYIPGNGVSIPDEPPIGCNCIVCSAETCSCVKESGGQFPYCPNGTIKISSRFPVYECNKLCKCSDNCVNRVVQKGCRAKLSIFRTSNGCGWGVKALESIPKGSFVCEYVGEVINTEEAEERGQKYDSVGQTYLFDLDFNDKEHCPYTVDAAFLGNISHFFNHSCCPNLTVHAVWINCLDPDLPKLAFFAKKPIQANQEITFDYHAQTVIPRASTSNIICKCKSVNCRKYLF